jgi:hypothetical protein
MKHLVKAFTSIVESLAQHMWMGRMSLEGCGLERHGHTQNDIQLCAYAQRIFLLQEQSSGEEFRYNRIPTKSTSVTRFAHLQKSDHST